MLSVPYDGLVSMSAVAATVAYREPDAPVGMISYANDAFCGLFGVALCDVVEQPENGVHQVEAWDALNTQISLIIASGGGQTMMELRCDRINGTQFWASMSVSVVQDAEAKGFHICVTYRDISDLKAREQAADAAIAERDKLLATQERLLAKQKRVNENLVATQDRLASAMDAYPEPFIIFDKDMRVVTCNAAYQKSMSAAPGQIVPGMHLRDILNRSIDANILPLGGQDRDQFIADYLSPEQLAESVTNLELAGDVHYRVIRSRAANGDMVVVRVNTTELVRQSRVLVESQDRLVAAIDAYPDPFSIYDKNQRLIRSNVAYRAQMSSDPDSIKPGMSMIDVLNISMDSGIIPMDGKSRQTIIDEYLAPDVVERETQDLTLTGDIHHRLLRRRAKNGDWVIVRVDTTEFVRQERALQASQDRLIAAINAFPDSFAIYDNDYNLLTWNPAFVSTITENPDDVSAGMNVRDVLGVAIANGHVPAAKGRECEFLSTYGKHNFEDQDVEFNDDTHYKIVKSPCENGEVVVMRLNITEAVRQCREIEDYAQQLETANEEITFQAFHDDLTGLGNRRYLTQKFDELSALRRQQGGELAALHIDLDRFKQINDTMGHAAGDHVLMAVAERIKAEIGPDDVVTRIGGDEFVVLMWVTQDCARPARLARDLLRVLSRPSVFRGRECRFAASIGLARTPLTDEANLLINSDVALYKAKHAGRGQVATFDLADLKELRRTKNLSDDIMRGLEAGEFVPFYQPQIDAATGRLIGLEALARWNHPQNGVMVPIEFLSVAAELNVVADIDKMIFERAIHECEQGFKGDGFHPRLSFNVSTNRLQLDNTKEIGRLAQGYSGDIAFELLETIFLEEESEDFLMWLDEIRDLGISLEVDDFGSGRASIVALQRISPDKLKIDRRLIAPMARDNSASKLVKSIIEIGQALDIGVVAEGVETREQAELLADLGADVLQGFFFSKPLSFNDLRGYLKQAATDGLIFAPKQNAS